MSPNIRSTKGNQGKDDTNIVDYRDCWSAVIKHKSVSSSRWSAMMYERNGTMPDSWSLGNSSPQHLSSAVGDSLRQTIAAMMKFPMGDVTL